MIARMNGFINSRKRSIFSRKSLFYPSFGDETTTTTYVCPKCNVEMNGYSYRNTRLFTYRKCLKCNTEIRNFDLFYRLIFRIYSKIKEIVGRIYIWFRNARNLCAKSHCDKKPEIFLYPIWDEKQKPQKIKICFTHAKEFGFCAVCHAFYGGVESFDFGKSKFTCDDCYEELNADMGLQEDNYDDDDFEEPY